MPLLAGVAPGLSIVATQLHATLSAQRFQMGIMVLALPFAALALFDGRKFFQILMTIGAGILAFGLVISQLAWHTMEGDETPEAHYGKYIIAIEAGLFIGYAAHKAWEGTQLVLGLCLGLYVYQAFASLCSSSPSWAGLVEPVVLQFAFGSAITLVTTYSIHQSLGGGKFLAILCPFLGGSVLSALAGYLYAMTQPFMPRDQVPCIIDYWLMVVFPSQNPGVGPWTYAHRGFDFAGVHLNADRTIGQIIWFVTAFFGVCVQLKAEREWEALGLSKTANAREQSAGEETINEAMKISSLDAPLLELVEENDEEKGCQ